MFEIYIIPEAFYLYSQSKSTLNIFLRMLIEKNIDKIWTFLPIVGNIKREGLNLLSKND